MKWIFFSLLLANLAYLGYQLLIESDGPAAVTGKFVEDEKRILLLSERKGLSDRALEAEAVLENPLTFDQEVQGDVCRGLGPFEDILSAQDVAERLGAAGFPIDLRAVDVSTGGADYRVVMPPLPSLQDAFRRLRELKSRGIDSYVIAEGADTQGISLGVFSSEVAARNQQEDLLAEGYDTELRVIDRVVRGYWLFAMEPRPFPEALLRSVTQEYSGVNVTETVCMN
jgi:hypothetical protein